MPSSPVKGPRRYDASGRRLAAARRRTAVLDAAAARFAAQGYAGATVADIAADAQVSVETVYKAFGGKPGLVRALWERALAGQGSVPAEQRSDAASGGAHDPHAVFAAWSKLSTEVAPRAAPVQLLLRDAAATDQAAAALHEQLERARLRRMAHNAKAIRRHLRSGLSVDQARDILFALTAPGLYEVLVMRQGWSVEAYGRFIERTLAAHLLDD